MNARGLRWGMAALIMVTSPAVFGFDLIARTFVVGSQPQDMQDFMAYHVTRIAWWALPFPVAGCVAGFLLYPRLYTRFLLRHRANPPAGSTPEARADLEALFLATTLVQLPSLLGDFSVLLGANLGPALCSMTITTVSVTLISVLGHRRTARG